MRTLPPDVGGRLPPGPQPDSQPSLDQRQDADRSSATRYLCVGAQIDGAFADRVIREVLEQPYRAVAPSFGLNMVPIVVHALNGRSRRKRRDILLVVLALCAFIVSPITATVTALGWLWIRLIYRIARQQWPSWHRRHALYLVAVASVMIVPILALTTFLLSLLVGLLRPYVENIPLVLAWPMYLGFWLPSPVAVLFIVMSLGLAWLILVWDRLSTRRVLIDTLRPEAFSSGILPFVHDYHPRLHDRFHLLQKAQAGSNLTVYSSYSPFLGSGDERQTWGLTIDLSRGARHSDGEVKEPRPFSITKLHRHVRRRLAALGDPRLPHAQRISNLMIEDRLFVSGGAVHRDPRLLPQRDAPPVAQVSARVMREYINNPSGPVRHFKCVRVDSWDREISFSGFLHLAVDGRTLYVELTVCVLLPIKPDYHLIDTLTRSLLPGERGAMLWETFKDVPASLLRAPVELFGYWRSRYREQRQDRVLQKMLYERLPIDYGARVSVRELGEATRYRNYFQALDWYRQLRVIQPEILSAILDFLEEHHIDTSEFRERQSAILNNGVVMLGSNIYNSTIAAGPGSSAVATTERPGTTGAGPARSTPKEKS
jgi:hypothetical protein